MYIMNYVSSCDYKTRLLFFDFLIITILIAVCIYLAKKADIITTAKDVLLLISYFTTLFVAVEFLLRLCHIFIHLMGANSQHDMDLQSMIKDAFQFNPVATIIITVNVVASVLLTSIRGWSVDYLWKNNLFVCMLSIIASWIILRTTSFSECNLQSTSIMTPIKGLDGGTMMAHMYYHGYLKIVLPSTGTASKGLLEKLENIEDTHNITIAAHKLFVLIPSSSYIPPDFKEASYQWMESAADLEEEVRDRAGNKRRKYRNTLYKIYVGGPTSGSLPKFIVAEGATPLLTLYEAQKDSNPESHIYKKYNRHIVKAFYTKLKDLLDNDPTCRDLCELIYYNDYDSNGRKVNVAEVILNRLSNLNN